LSRRLWIEVSFRPLFRSTPYSLRLQFQFFSKLQSRIDAPLDLNLLSSAAFSFPYLGSRLFPIPPIFFAAAPSPFEEARLMDIRSDSLALFRCQVPCLPPFLSNFLNGFWSPLFLRIFFFFSGSFARKPICRLCS